MSIEAYGATHDSHDAQDASRQKTVDMLNVCLASLCFAVIGCVQALDSSKISWFHIKTIIVAGMGFFCDAYDVKSVAQCCVVSTARVFVFRLRSCSAFR